MLETTPETTTPEEEHKYHTYRGHYIPWYVRLLWVGFYSLAIYYVARYMFPAMREEFRPSAKQVPAQVSPPADVKNDVEPK